MSFRSRVSKLLIAITLIGFVYPISAGISAASATPNTAPVITSILSPKSSTLEITYTPPVDQTYIEVMLYSTDSGATYSAPLTDSCAATPGASPWIATASTCTMTINTESWTDGGGGHHPLLPGIPHSISLLSSFEVNPAPNYSLIHPDQVSNTVVVQGDSSINLVKFPTPSSIFYGGNAELIYFDNSAVINKWWGIAYSIDSGTTWNAADVPRSDGIYISCEHPDASLSIHFDDCSINGLTADATIQFAYYMDPNGSYLTLADSNNFVDTSTDFILGIPSDPIPFKYTDPTKLNIYSNLASFSQTPGEQSATFNFAAPTLTTAGGPGSFKNVYYAYAINNGHQWDQDLTQWNFNQSDLKPIDGQTQETWTITKQIDGQSLQNGTPYDFAFAYYIPGLSNYVVTLIEDGLSPGYPRTFTITPVPTPPTITDPTPNLVLSANVGQVFTHPITASDGVTPYSYDVAYGRLPPGITVDSTTGVISGTPSAPGTFESTLRVTTLSGGESTIGPIYISVAQSPLAPPDNNSWIQHKFGDDIPDWASIVSSTDGSHLVASGSYTLWTSSDYGTSWTDRSMASLLDGTPTALDWKAIASSADGSHLVGVENSTGNIWTSTDYGVDWTARPVTSAQYWNGITSSADGSHLAAIAHQGDIWTSNDYGVTWTDESSTAGPEWLSIASNGDGSRLIAGSYIGTGGSLYISSDYGNSWIPTGTHPDSWLTVASNDDGSKLFAGTNFGYMWTSFDSGTSWVQQSNGPGGGDWYGLGSSADGTHLIGISQDLLYTSTDSGVHWQEALTANTQLLFTNQGTWNTAAISGNGSFLAATGNDVDIWTGPALDYDATLIAGTIRDTSVVDLGTPSLSLLTALPGSETLTLSAALDSTLSTFFTTTSESATVTKLVKYSSGASVANFAADIPFTNQDISPGDFLGVEVTSAKGTHLYYRIDLSILPGNIAPDFTSNVLTFGPTVIGQSETQTLQISFNSRKMDDASGNSSGGFGFTPVGDIQSSIGNFTYSTDPSDPYIVPHGCLGEVSNTWVCYITVSFTPTSVGSQDALFYIDFTWADTSTFEVKTEREVLSFKATGIPTPTKSYPPLTWMPHTVLETQTWQAISSSADGSHLAAVIFGGDIYTSEDFGTTWTDRTATGPASGGKLWTSITSSRDGMSLAATIYRDPISAANSPIVYLSTDGGLSWLPGPTFAAPSGNNHGVTSITSSADGLKIAFTDACDSDSGYIYISNDGGATWVTSTTNDSNLQTWSSIAMNADGSKLIAADAAWNVFYGRGRYGDIYTSSDGGQSWEMTTAGNRIWMSVASNSDGSRLAAAESGGDIWISSDFGQTWETTTAGTNNWTYVTSSLDGSHLAATAAGDYIYTSEDYGVTWESQTVAGQNAWTSIASSASGDLLAATGANIDIWTRIGSTPPPAPAPTALALDPSQRSHIDSISPLEIAADNETPIVLNGSFIENVNRIDVNGVSLPVGIWKQTPSAISFLLAPQKPGSYLIQLFNGASPLLAPQIFTVKVAAKIPASNPNPSPATPATKPAPSNSRAGAPTGTNPLPKTLSLNVYFDMASYKISGTNLKKLEVLAKRLSGLSTAITITVTGFAQPTPGSEATDGALSKRRAAAVAKILRKYGVNTRLTYLGAGRAAVNDASSRYVQIVAANS